MQVEEKDRKILAELDKNARNTDSNIAKKVRMSKQVVNYRIKNLIDKKVISNFYTVLNIGKLGLNSYYVFLQLEKLNKEDENKLLEKISKLDYVGWLVSGTGRWDAVLLVYSKSLSEFNILLNNIRKICGKHLHEVTFSSLTKAEHIGYKFLKKEKENPAEQTEKSHTFELSETDKKILKTISVDARKSIVEISEETKIPPYTIKYNLKKLEKEKIIEGYKPKIDTNLLGYQWYLLLIQLQSISAERKNQLIEFCKNHKNIYYITNTIGAYNFMIDIHVKDTREFKEVLLDLKEKFSDTIKLYESIVIFEEYKINYFPEKSLK